MALISVDSGFCNQELNPCFIAAKMGGGVLALSKSVYNSSKRRRRYAAASELGQVKTWSSVSSGP
jgi:hypothetical protein